MWPKHIHVYHVHYKICGQNTYHVHHKICGQNTCSMVIFNCILRVHSLVPLMGVSIFVVSCAMIVMRGNVWLVCFVLLIVFVSVHRLLGQSWVVLLQRKMYTTWHSGVECGWIACVMHGIHGVGECYVIVFRLFLFDSIIFWGFILWYLLYLYLL